MENGNMELSTWKQTLPVVKIEKDIKQENSFYDVLKRWTYLEFEETS